jgi:site-specific recombinase XerD
MKKLTNMRTQIDEVVDRLKYEKKHIDHKSISDYFLVSHLFDIGLVAYVRNVKEQKTKQVSLSKETPLKYEQLAVKLENYIRDTYRVMDIDIKKVDHSFIIGFDTYLCSIVSSQFNKPLSKTTINKTHGFFRTVLNQAYDEDYINIKPYSRFKLKKADSVIRYLTKEELNRLENLDLSNYPKLDRARDLFLFTVYTGLRYGDTQRITTDNLKDVNGVLFYFLDAQEKTQNPVENPVYPKAKLLIDKYSDSAERLIESRLMPKMSNPVLNGCLKEVAEKAGINQKLYHHMARHTCATTILLENGVPIEMVKEFLGHKNISSTMVYAKITNTNKIKAMERVKLMMSA